MKFEWGNLKIWLKNAALGAGLLIPGSSIADSVEISSFDGISGNGVGGSIIYFKHQDGSDESYDINDSSWSNAPTNPDPKWLKIYTAPYISDLKTDSRPTNSESIFHGNLSAVDTVGDTVTATNQIKFRYLSKDSTRLYFANICCFSNWTPNGQPFSWSGVTTNNQYVNLPGIVSCSSGTVY